MPIDLEKNITSKPQPKAIGCIVYSSGGLGKSTFLIDAVNSTKNGVLFRVGNDGIAALNRPVRMYNEVLARGDTREQAIQGWMDIQEVLKQVYLLTAPLDVIAFDEFDNAVNHALYQYVLDKYYKKTDGSIDIKDANGWGGNWIKEGYTELYKIIKMFDMIQQKGTAIYLSLHSQASRFRDPMQVDDYKKYVFDIPNRDDSNMRELLMNWADVVLFGTIDVIVGEGNKASGTRHILKTKESAAYKAKSRYAIPEQIAFEYKAFKDLIDGKK